MFADQQKKFLSYNRICLIIAGVVGLLVGIIALFWLAIPAWAMLPQSAQFALPTRTVLVIKACSPLISFLLAGGWAWVLLKVGEFVFNRGENTPQPIQTLPSASALPSSYAPEMQWEQPQQQARGDMGQALPYSLPFEQPDLPVTPLPPTSDLFWSDSGLLGQSNTSDQVDVTEDTDKNERQQITTTKQIIRTTSSDRGDDLTSSFSTSGDLSNAKPITAKPVAISLLKELRVQLLAPNGMTRQVKLRGGANGIRFILLAYIAWRRSKPVDRDKVLTHVLARGRRRDMDTDQLGFAFDAAKKYLREDLKKAVVDFNKEAGTELIAEGDIDFFSNEPGFYWLHPSCRVVDLEEIEQQHNFINLARRDGLLDEKVDGSIPEWVATPCLQLLEAYQGDFLQALIEKFPQEFGAWVREPYTLYRDYYLDALWVVALYYSALGRTFFDAQLPAAQNEELCRNHIGKAAHSFNDYAMYAINSRVDSKLKFANIAGKDGERVIMAAQAIRRCVLELAALGKADMIDQVYLTFKEKMSTLSEGQWKPDRELESAILDAKQKAANSRTRIAPDDASRQNLA
jgi:hypothetical protein